MPYTFKGRLCGYICPECPENLGDVTVRLYRSREKNVAALAVANAKETFAILSEDQVKAKAGSLLAEARTAADGSFSIELDDKQKYHGEAFEIDVYCGTVPHLKPGPRPPQPLQFSITTLQPAWRGSEETGFVAAWEYCIPHRFWCIIRGRFGAWTICGIVVDCDTGTPISGVRVRAFDTDWLQDDDLGSGITDGSGRFRIDYLRSDFEKTPLSPFVNVELIGGPDVYFKVETMGGIPLLAEPRSQGRTPGRENVGPCFCVRLCLKGAPPTDGNPIPLFTHVGEYRVDPIYSDFTADGLTTAGNLAFTDSIPLRGLLPNGNAPDPLEYHFRWGEYDPSGTTLGPVTDLDASQIAPTVIGQLEYYDYDNVNNVFVLRSANYWANNPGAPTTVIHRNGLPDLNVQLNQVVKAGGWIEVPRENNLAANGTGLFVGGFTVQAMLDTTKLTLENFDLTTPPPSFRAGDSMAAGKKSRTHRFKLIFEARKVASPPPPILATNARDQIVLSNTWYTQQHHPNWAGFTDTRRCVILIDAAELAVPGGGCGQITSHVHALFTAYHPFLGSAKVYVQGPTPPPLPPQVTPPISADGEAVSPPGGQDFNLSSNPDCAYILWIQLSLRLTRGYGAFLGDFYDHVAFCKG